jgi:spore coat polysaccharide biosynthesis protein SpsF (cytidylyltransferase family)
MNLNKQKLQVRLTIIMTKEDYNFFTNLTDYKKKLKEYFNCDYTEDEIENSLHEIEEAYIEDEFEREQASYEIPEDFDI